jgi:carboxyl-terminal processing protease
MSRRLKFITMTSFLAFATFSLFALPHLANSQEKADEKVIEASSIKNTYELLNLFGNVFERVREEYVEEVTDQKLIEYAINGMLTSLDPHSGYLNEKDFEDMQAQTSGEFGGLGIEVTMENGLVKVVSPIDDTPASRAGMQTGDLISKINDDAVMGMSLNDAVSKMRGKPDTEIVLTVIRKDEPEPITVKLTRAIIKIESVKSRVEGNAGYIRITTFNQQTSKGLEEAITKIKKELGDNLTGYVLDLRNNPGGLLDQAIAVSDAFLNEGEIVSTRGRDPSSIRRDNATKGDLADGKPIVVLINGGSASASEIVSGALQDHKRGVILGTQSFGKGSVQSVMGIPKHGAIKLTTARYYTPSGRSIQAEGIKPDIIVERVRVYGEDDKSQGFKEADLKGALDKKEHEKAKPLTTEKDEDAKAIDDYQLLRALDLLQGLTLFENKKMPIPKGE